ncbi:MAG TPA: ATP-dependent DNA helicase [Gammaproteobacteria bacterium]|nr:ATP-dependent DNA helicase [Gammaproteobacteria bacterium]
MTTSYFQLMDGDGALASAIVGFQPRREQQLLAEAIGRALDHAGLLAAEAGTGVGKTFAYLAPVLQAGRKALISTGTRTLQDQIFHRDLPVVRRALGQPVKVALLKGRSNYLCRHRLDLVQGERNLKHADARDLMAVQTWAGRTTSGDRAELEAVPETSRIWSRVTSTTDNCLGTECPVFSNCWVVKARREAQQADVVVVNHHLLLADMALKDEGFGELLPNVDAVIVDEAHQFPDVAGQYFGESVSARQLRELSRDTLAEYLKSAGDMPELRPCLDHMETALSQLRLSLGEANARLDWSECRNGDQFAERLETLTTTLSDVRDHLDVLAERSRGLDNCFQRAQRFADRLAALGEADDDANIRWAETWNRNVTFHLTPHDVAPRLAEHIHAGETAWIFTSATLAVADSLDHFCTRIGLENADRLILGSPFDYAHNALLYTPAGLPQTNAPGYTEAVIDAALPLIEANRGRAFLLFTSHRALRRAAGYLADRCDFELLVQGDAPRSRLIERFRQSGEAVLLGTSSFWEGVDVKGAALSLVVIDKLPFAAPNDPVLKARLAALAEAGGNPFMDIQLPQAVIALKQGVGRLIRDAADTGVMMLCDPRLSTRHYGRVFLASLPPMRRTAARDEALAFIDERVAPTPAELFGS